MDIKGEMTISDEELLLIKKMCEEKCLDMFYLGTAHLDDFLRLEFTYQISDDEMSFQYCGSKYYGTKAPETPYCNWYARHGLFRSSDGDINDEILLQYYLFFELVNQSESFTEKVMKL